MIEAAALVAIAFVVAPLPGVLLSYISHTLARAWLLLLLLAVLYIAIPSSWPIRFLAILPLVVIVAGLGYVRRIRRAA